MDKYHDFLSQRSTSWDDFFIALGFKQHNLSSMHRMNAKYPKKLDVQPRTDHVIVPPLTIKVSLGDLYEYKTKS